MNVSTARMSESAGPGKSKARRQRLTGTLKKKKTGLQAMVAADEEAVRRGGAV